MKQEFKKLLVNFQGLECWSSVAGSGTGSIFSLHFGNNIPRKAPIRNPHLSIGKRNYDSEYSLMVWSSWNLFKDKLLIYDSNSSNENDGQMVVGLKQLVGKKIKQITLKDTSLNLEIEFDSGYRMIVLTDGYDLYGDDTDNYVLFFPMFTISITTGLEIKKSLR